MANHDNTGGEEYFLGFPRSDGSCGTRNHVLILSVAGLTGPAARRVARNVQGSLVVSSPYGRCQLGEDAALHRRTLIGIGRNPNVGAVVVIGADRPTVQDIVAEIAKSGKPVEGLSLQDVDEDSLELSMRGIRLAGQLVRAISAQRRTELPVARLFIGLECGLSDSTSGLVANPLAGHASDWLVDRGGRVVIGETLEWLGAETILAARAGSAELGERIVQAVRQREADIVKLGVDLTGNNPGPENILGGLSTIEEKALGAVTKAGSRQFRDLVPMSAACGAPGLYGMDATSFAPESMTGFVASGANILLFTTGRGNSLCSLITPTIKISANPSAATRLSSTQIDFDASSVFKGLEHIEGAAEKLCRLIVEVASGTATCGEIFIEGDEAFARVGASI